MKDLKKISELWREIHDKENELSDLTSSFEGMEVEYIGRPGVIDNIDPGNDIAWVKFNDGERESVDFDKLY